MMIEEPITKNIDESSPISFITILDQLTLNLKVMGDIKNSDKLSVVNEHIEINPYSYIRCIHRTYTGDSRVKSLEKVNEVTEDVIKISDQLLKLESFSINIINLPENNCKILQDLIPDMINANKGLTNLKTTYQNDVLTENKLDMLIKKMSDQVDKIKSQSYES